MKQFYFAFVFSLVSIFAYSQEPFITTWNVSGGDLDITIPTTGTGYNYTIDFGDGTVQNNVTGDATHNYNSPGIYTVSITGDFPRIFFYISGQSQKILSVEQWGDIQWESMQFAFSGCSNLVINATDAPDLSQVTDMSNMFGQCTSFNQSIDHWNVSNITIMSSIFNGSSSFDQPLNNWDVSNVTNMAGMFMGASSFNQDIGNWDVSNVTTMRRMFRGASMFNQSIDNWSVFNLQNMISMFENATSFNQSLTSWDIFNLTDINYMFKGASMFNQSLNNLDVSNVTIMLGLFDGAIAYNHPLNNWDVSNVTNMSNMFSSASSFNQPLNNWNVSNVTTMTGLFIGASSFNQPLNNWDVSNVTNMERMFTGATSFNQPLDNWDVSSVLSMNRLFYNATSFNQNISYWNFNANVTFTQGPFSNFLDNSGLNSSNYDALLTRFVNLELQNKVMRVTGLFYCDPDVRDYLINDLGWNIMGDMLGNGLICSNNTVSGKILYDANGNGCDINDIHVNNVIVSCISNSFSNSTTSVEGNYLMNLYEGIYSINLQNIPSYFSVTPATTTITFSGSNNVEIVDFCLTANQVVNDLNITLLAINEARPGFEADYQLVVRNVGTETINNVSATLNFDAAMQTFVIALPGPNSTTGSSLSFELGTVQPFETRYIDIIMQTFPPPTVEGDDILNFTATVTPDAGDYTPEDNTYELEQVVVNSFDPNDKQVMQGAEVHIDDVDQYLDYLIRFQNTGTASAINVRILDTLHPKLDWGTLIPISASHDYVVQITDGNRVEFMFDNIHLPDSLSNEPESHGFVAYKIKPKNDVQVGDVISGDAGIYFDFNPPIITNMVFTEIVENLDVTDILDPANQIVVYPNPTSKLLHLYIPEGIQIEGATIYDLQGKNVQQLQGTETVLDVEKLSPGLYFLEITTNEGTINRRFVKR